MRRRYRRTASAERRARAACAAADRSGQIMLAPSTPTAAVARIASRPAHAARSGAARRTIRNSATPGTRRNAGGLVDAVPGKRQTAGRRAGRSREHQLARRPQHRWPRRNDRHPAHERRRSAPGTLTIERADRGRQRREDQQRRFEREVGAIGVAAEIAPHAHQQHDDAERDRREHDPAEPAHASGRRRRTGCASLTQSRIRSSVRTALLDLALSARYRDAPSL